MVTVPLPSRSGKNREQLRSLTGLHVPLASSRVPDGTRSDCRMAVTAAPRTNGRRLRLRCTCMAQANVSRPLSYFAYDWIAEGTLDEIKRAWREHIAARTGHADHRVA